MRVTPKIIDSPDATRNSDDALASPFRNWMRMKSIPLTHPCCASLLRPELRHLGVARHVVLAVVVVEIDHHALAVLERGLADIGAHGRLMVGGAEGDGA